MDDGVSRLGNEDEDDDDDVSSNRKDLKFN